MSKSIGQKITIKFTEELVGDVTGLIPKPIAAGDYFRPLGTATASSQYSSYAPTRAFDGNVTGSYWYTRTTGDQWVQIELAEPTWIYGFRWYVDSYRPNGFDFQGSNDGENWEGILTGNSPNATGWHEFTTDSLKQYKYYRWTVTSRYSSYLYIYEIELLGAVGNEGAFTITGKEYQYVNGPLIDKEYQVDKVERYGGVPIWRLGDSVALEDDSILEDFEDDTLHPSLSLTGTWTRSTRDAQTGSYSLESNNKTNNSDASSYLTFNASAGKSFSIGYKVSSEANYDKFYLYHNDVVKVNGISGAGSWLTYNGITTEGTNVIRVRYTKDGSTSRNLDAGFIDNFYLEGNYYTPKIINIDGILYTGQCRVKWQEVKPEDTDITIEYTTGEAQGEWVEVSNGEVITSDTNLWFRVTLETTDTSVTPTLQDLWLEEPDVPNDLIRLVMHPQGRFNNVEGPLTVQYDQTVGSLRGSGGPVEGFTETFTPTDLEPKPNPGIAENLEVSAEANVAFTKVTYNQRYADEHITVSASATVDFVYVGIINP